VEGKWKGGEERSREREGEWKRLAGREGVSE
jgi:hypothetical protein